MTTLATTRQGGHDWVIYDEHHRACRACGLRLFYQRDERGRGGAWVLLNWNGQPNYSLKMLGSGSGDSYGACTRPPRPPVAEPVIIEYTGNPDEHPGCERYMHRLEAAHRDDFASLVTLSAVAPVCGWKCEFWEIGPAREHPGWTWCLECWGKGRSRKARPVLVRRTAAPALPAPIPRALPAPKAKAKPKGKPKPRAKR